MFGSRKLNKTIIALSLGIMLIMPVYAEDFNYGETQRRISLNEEFGDYMASVRTKIFQKWTPPNVLEEGHAGIVFKLDKNGNVISAYVKESSGNTLYDQSAINSVQQAAPYPKFPDSASRDNITVMYSFDSSIVDKDEVKRLVAESEKLINRNNQLARNIIDTAIKTIEGDPAAYFLYARRHKLDKLMGDTEAAKADMAEFKRLKTVYDSQRINKCKEALALEETPFGYFTLANAYELAGDYQKALNNIDKAISMTELNHAYKRYRAELIMKSDK